MLKTTQRTLWLTLASSAVLVPDARAQGGAPRSIDPQDVRVQVPAATHGASLSRYRSYSVETARSWREANDNVARIGGWRTYLRQAAEPDSVPPAQPAKPLP